MTDKISIRYYLISVILPIICIFGMFGFATKYIQDEINFTQHELAGLKNSNGIHLIVTNLQKLRGINNMTEHSKKYDLEKKQYIYEIKESIKEFKKILKPNDKEHLAHKSIYNFLSSILQLFKEEHNFSKEENFQNYSVINEKSFAIQKDIALYSNLILDPYNKSYLLMETVSMQLPKLIEFSGQLRAMITAHANKSITKVEFNDFTNRISKINNLSNDLSYNMNKLFTLFDADNEILISNYENTVLSKDNLLEYIYSNFTENSRINDTQKVYEFFTNNINFMIGLYNVNSKILTQMLESRLEYKTSIRNFIVIIAIISILFILYSFLNYYLKNRDLITEIKNSNQKLKKQSITDGLTNLYNRRYFDIIFKQQFNSAKRENHSFVFILCDIDNFKKYNDTYGHVKGDKTLVSVANALRDSLKRPNDFTFRIGGEEFGIIISNLTFEKAKCFAKTINRLASNA